MELTLTNILPIVYLVGLVIMIVLVLEYTVNPKHFRVPFAIFMGVIWPLVLALVIVLHVENFFLHLKNLVTGGYSDGDEEN